MKIAIHDTPGSFSDRWIKYCNENKTPFKLVNCYSPDIVAQLSDCNGLMWHWSQTDYKAMLFARQLTTSLETKGIKVFPDVNTAWHFDDKVGQKYLLEAINAPLVNSYVFYSKKDTLEWINKTNFPKVLKLRGGAGSNNVRLVKTKNEAIKLTKKAFGKGFLPIDRFSRLKDRIWFLKRDKNFKALFGIIKGLGRLFILTEFEKFSTRQKGYIYFQDFIPGNNFDSRIVVIGNRCFAIRRYCRKGDFRASGSGVISCEPELFSKEVIKIAFEVSKRLKVQSIAYDFIFDKDEPKIVEISYGFTMGYPYDDCPGYWDVDLNWYSKPVNPQYFMIEDFIRQITKA